MSKILMIIAQEGFRDEELHHPKDVFETAGAKVTIAAQKAGKAKGRFGTEVEADISYKDANASDYDALVFVGGPGAREYFDDKVAHNLATDAYSAGKIVAAICVAPVTLANAGLLKNKSATCFPSVEDDIVEKGAKYTGVPVEEDGRIVTANGPAAAMHFGQVILGKLD